MIDSAWFYQQLEKEGRSLRAMARVLGLDPSAVSRMLRGERKMSAEEQDGIAAYFGVPLAVVAARRRGEVAGFAEEGQEGYAIGPGRKPVEDIAGDLMTEKDNEAGLSFYERVRGCMKGTITIMPGTDLTAPTDPEWAKVYDDD